eukprot:UN01039
MALDQTTISMALDFGVLFVEQGQLYIVNGINTAVCVDSNHEFTNEVEIGGCEYKLVGAVDLSLPLQTQTAYWITLSSYYKLKCENKTKVNNNMVQDIIKNMRTELLNILNQKNAGMKRNVLICSCGKTTWKEVQKNLSVSEIVDEKWRECKISFISGILTPEAIKRLIGKKKYPLKIGAGIITLQGVRFMWINQSNHIRKRPLRVECHVVSTNTSTCRVIGGVN